MRYYQEEDKKNILKLREVLKTLPEFLGAYFLALAINTAVRTRLSYARDLRVFFEYIHTLPDFSDIDIEDYTIDTLNRITRTMIDEYLEHLSLYVRNGIELSNTESGKKHKLAAVRSMYAYFDRMEKIEKNPAYKVLTPKIHEKEIIRLEKDEVKTMIKEVKTAKEFSDHQQFYYAKTKKRDIAIITLLLGTGIRVSECVGIDIEDISFKDNGITVHRKGGNEYMVYFGDDVKKALKAYIKERELIQAKEGSEEALFLSMQNKRISVRAVEKLVKKYSELTTNKHITPHKLRSTFGTALYNETGDIYLVADVLGHKDVNTTRRHYAAIKESNRKKVSTLIKLS